MSKSSYKISHFVPKKSSVSGKKPSDTILVEGELAVNTASEKIYLRNNVDSSLTDEKIATFSSDAYNDERFVNASGDSVDGKLGVADTLSVSGNAIFSSGITMPYMGENVVLQDLISGNSYVTSQALNDLNQRINAIGTYVGKTDIPEGKTVMGVIVENEQTAADAINKIATAAGVIDSDDKIAYTAPTASGEFSTTKSIMDMLNHIDSVWNSIDCGTY